VGVDGKIISYCVLLKLFKISVPTS